jgi:hypothetical protein
MQCISADVGERSRAGSSLLNVEEIVGHTWSGANPRGQIAGSMFSIAALSLGASNTPSSFRRSA